jgi:glucose-1-phosphate cytidylyltransferase
MKSNPAVCGKWAVILCGGRGSRLGPITEHKPKPLVEVHGEPILWYSFLCLYKHGFRHFVFPLRYRGDMIRDYLHKTFGKMDCDIHCVDTGEDTSIARRIAQIADVIPENEDFFLINSDTIFDFDVSAMYAMHKAEKALVTLSSVEVISAWGLLHLRDGKLVNFDRERKIRYLAAENDPTLQGRVNSGLTYISKLALRCVDLETCGDFETTLYQTIIAAGRASHFELRGCWFPIDTPKDLDIVNMRIVDTHSIGHTTRAVLQSLSEMIHPSSVHGEKHG